MKETTKSVLYCFGVLCVASLGIIFVMSTWVMLDRYITGRFDASAAVADDDGALTAAIDGRDSWENVPAWFESIDSGFDAKDLSGYTVFCDTETGNVYLYQRGHSRISMTAMFDGDKPMTKERYSEIKDKYGSDE